MTDPRTEAIAMDPIEQIQEILDASNQEAWATGYATAMTVNREVLFFATYIGPLVIAKQDEFIRWVDDGMPL